MCEKKKVACAKCAEDVEYEIRSTKWKKVIRGKEYEFDVDFAYCKQCGEKVYIEGFWDNFLKEIDEQYQKMENIVTIEELDG